MIQFPRIVLALALACLFSTPALAGPFNSYPAAPPPNGTAIGLAWQGGPTVVTTSNAWMRANLGIAQVRTLESFAVALGVTLGTSDDGAVITAANNAIIAAANSGGLIVSLPSNAVTYSSVGLIADNWGGWRCEVLYSCVFRQVRASTSSATTWAFQINPSNPAATGISLEGITFDGQWTYASGAYASNPASDPALDAQGAVNLTVQFNGDGDAAYMANSAIAAQEPHIIVRNIRIGRFGGTGFKIQGAGANLVDGVVEENVGGVGMDIDTYDSHFANLDIGATGRQPFLCHDNCASDTFTNLKGWYGGYRQVSGATAGFDEEGGSSNIVSGLYIQDEAGDCLKRDNADLGIYHVHCQWQGYINTLPGQVCALRSLASIDSQIEMNVSLINHSGQTYQNVNKLICDGRSLRNTGVTGYSTHNHVSIVTEGFPQDFNGFSPGWISGPFDTSNSLKVNGVPRQSAQWAQDPATGQVNFGVNLCNTLSGLVVFGRTTQYVNQGAMSLIAACGNTGALQSETTTGTFATGALTSTANYADGETVTAGNQVYTFKTILTGAPNEVHLGSTEAQSNQNLAYAINAATPTTITAASVSGSGLTVSTVSGVLHVGDTVTSNDPLISGWVTTTITSAAAGGGQGPYTLANSEPTVSFTDALQASSGTIGTDYGYGTLPSYQVSAAAGPHTVSLTALAIGTGGNTIPTSTTAAHASWGGADLSGGLADNQTYTSTLQWNGLGLTFQGIPTVQGVQPTFTGNCPTGAQTGATGVGYFTLTASCAAGTYVILTFPNSATNVIGCIVQDTVTGPAVWAVGGFTPNAVKFVAPASGGNVGDVLIWSCPSKS